MKVSVTALQTEIPGVRHGPPQSFPMAKVHPRRNFRSSGSLPDGEKFPDPSMTSIRPDRPIFPVPGSSGGE